jgi:hypothetical protein
VKRWLLGLAALALGCGAAPESGSERVHWLDYSEFKTSVQPLLAEGCSNPSCHARPDRALSLYAPMARRIDPTRTHLPEPLTEEELMHNYVVSCVLSSEADAPADTLLLKKPLGEWADTYHGGGAVFAGPSDDRYRVLEAWVARGFEP